MKVHLIGICGTATATLAAMLKVRGHDVQGSDHGVYPPMSDFLREHGIRVFDGYRAEQIDADVDLVVVGNAISRGNAELEAVLDRKQRYVSLPEAIRDEFLWRARSIVIAGTHGKTTTTSLTGWLLTAGGMDPSVLVGGIAANFGGSFRLGGGRAFVIEGDEYDSAFFDKTAKFLKYLPDVVVVGNLEHDHVDIYPDLESVRVAFRRLLNLVPRSGYTLIGADCEESLRLRESARSVVETFGLAETADWHAGGLAAVDMGTRFTLRHRGDRFGEFVVPLLGVHNVRNAAAAIAVGHRVGLTAEAMRDGLIQFKGIKRRLELRGRARGVSVLDDFAHHPTAIFETIRAVKSTHGAGSRVWAIFEPRSATSCRRLFQDDFVRAFDESGADEIVLAAVFRASLPEQERLDAPAIIEELTRRGRNARYLPTVPEIVETIAAAARDGDLIVVMSNGGFDGIHEKLLARLRGDA